MGNTCYNIDREGQGFDLGEHPQPKITLADDFYDNNHQNLD